MADIRESDVAPIAKLSGSDRFDQIGRRVRVALGGAIVGSCVIRIVASLIGHDTTIFELAGALIGFLAVYPIADGRLPGDT